VKKRLIVGISGASGPVYAVRMLEILHDIDGIETHLVISDASALTISAETKYHIDHVKSLADVYHDNSNIGASIASGSFATAGMVVIPCSIKTLSGIANSFNENLLIRAADVSLKEKRKLVLVVRETPFHKGHLKLMLQAADIGAIIAPAIPAFYTQPQSIDDIINQSVGRILDMFDINVPALFSRWSGESK
jgi:4-hydroxy-3-polyprenylbenzoate decarboxylase